MATAERDFSNFNSGDNVYELAGGLIPDIAERLEVPLGDQPTSEDLQNVMDVVGTNKVLRDNQEVTALSFDDMVELVKRSGVQKPLRRSLWSPEIEIDSNNVDAIVIVSGMANWQDRVSALVEDLPSEKPVYSLAGPRVMDSRTEKTNPNVVHVVDVFGKYPTEAEYAGSVIVPKLVAAHRDVLVSPFATGVADDMFAQFFEGNPDLLDARLVMARVANAGIIMAIQLRNAARNKNPAFDSRPLSSPQVFVATDSFPLARTAEDETDARHYQWPASALRQVILTAKKLYEASTQ